MKHHIDVDARYPWDLLIGGSRHPYGVSPENETAWCRLFLLYGMILGAIITGVINSVLP